MSLQGNDDLKIRAALWFAWWDSTEDGGAMPFADAIDFVSYLCDSGLLGQEARYYRFYANWKADRRCR